MADDQAPPAEAPQTPVSDGLASTPNDPLPPTPSEPTPAPAVKLSASNPTPQAAVPSEPAQSASEVAPEPTPDSTPSTHSTDSGSPRGIRGATGSGQANSPQAAPAEPTQGEPVEMPVVEVETPRQPAAKPEQPQRTPPPTPTASSIVGDLLIKARAAIQTKKQRKLDRIMEFVARNNSITNNEVEKLVHVSDTTATRYLEILVREGKLRRIGTTGKAVRYEKS